MYVAENFIAPFSPNSKTIRILYPDGRISFTLMVCNYQKSSVAGKTLNIILEDGIKEYKLLFGTKNEAQRALVSLKQAVDSLKRNCPGFGITNPGGGDGDPNTGCCGIIPITYLQYKQLRANNELIPLQWYDVRDSTGIFYPIDTIMRLQAKFIDDPHPSGAVIDNTSAFLRLNTWDDSISFYENGNQKITAVNTFAVGVADNISTNIFSSNKSIITPTNSHFVEAQNESVVVVSDSSNILVQNFADIKIKNAENVSINDIQQDLTLLPFNLTDVTIDRNTSIGKGGNIKYALTGNKNLQSYYDFVNQELQVLSDNTTYIVTLYNLIPQACAEFYIRYEGGSTGSTIVIKNKDNSTLFVFHDGLLNIPVRFTYNKRIDLFEVTFIGASINYNNTTNEITNIYNNEVVEKLTVLDINVLSDCTFRPVPSSRTLLFVNGKEEDSVSTTPPFTVNGKTIVWNETNAGYQLNPFNQCTGQPDTVVVRYLIA